MLLAKQQKEQELQGLYQKIQQTYQDNQQALQKAQQEKMQPVFEQGSQRYPECW